MARITVKVHPREARRKLEVATPPVDGCAVWTHLIYATALPTFQISTGYTKYVLTVTGKLMADDIPGPTFLEDLTIGCRTMALPSPVVGSNFEGWTAWNSFHVETIVALIQLPIIFSSITCNFHPASETERVFGLSSLQQT
jgi:hypothetical protein